MLNFKACELIVRLNVLFKQKAPGPITRLYVGGSLHKLQAEYKPKPYQGSMIIFRSPGIFTDPSLGWNDFVKGEIKTIDIPGMHVHRREIMNEPFVETLSEELKNFLDK